MFKVIRMKDSVGTDIPVFVGCTETGYSAKDILTMPGAYDECASSSGGVPLSMCKFSGTIGAYRTECYVLRLNGDTQEVQDLTGDVSRILVMPATAANAMLQSFSAEFRDDLKQALDSVHFYETVKAHTKVCLPEDAMAELDPTVVQTMRSARQTFVLRATENQEIFQQAFDAEFGVRLPSLEDIHSEDGFNYSSLDIIRSTMPYRRPGNPPAYEPIYHTPYFKTGNMLGQKPPYLQWLEGYSSNDLLDIQPNERHMQRNLYILYQSDVARYVAEIVTGVFFNTEFGSRLTKLRLLRDKEAIDRMVSEIRSAGSTDDADGVRCDISTEDIEALWANDWNPTEVGQRIKNSLHFGENYLANIVKAQHPAKRLVTTRNLMFVLSLTDAQEQYFTDAFIAGGFMTNELHEFFIKLCQRAYEANWGHTGSSKAVPPLVYQTEIPDVAKEFTRYLTDRMAGKAPTAENYPWLYRKTYGDDSASDDDADDFFMVDDGKDSDDTPSIAFDHYITSTTAGRLLAGETDINTLYDIREDESDAERKVRLEATQNAEARKIERWRIPGCDGNSNLVYFLTGAYMMTADVKIYIQAFIKLVRWGDRRPKVLAFPDHPEIRIVFDLCNGAEGDNTAVVYESDLVKVNGCDYSFAGFLCSTTNNDINPQHILGFLLEKNYGTVVKPYLASWEDLAEMVQNCTINIGQFKTGAAVDANPSTFTSIESFDKKSYEIYESDKNVAEGLKLEKPGRELSPLVLLPRPQIMSERSYIKSTASNAIITTTDRQYDILRRYTDNLRTFYKVQADRLANIHNTTDLQELALEFMEVVAKGAGAKQEHNEQAAAGALSKMELDMGGPKVEPQYITAALPAEARYTLVNDPDNVTIMQDTWDPIPFTDPQLQQIATRGGVSIVLLLLKTKTCWVLCRKDLSPKEVGIVQTAKGRNISCVGYDRLRSQIDALLRGQKATYQGLPISLHISAKLGD